MSTNIAQRFWKMSVNVPQIEISETFVCLVLILDITPALPFDALRGQVPSAVILTCLMEILSRLTIC